MSMEPFRDWLVHHPPAIHFMDGIKRAGYNQFGLRPQNAAEERQEVQECLDANKHLHLGQTRYLIKLRWWEQWERYTDGAQGGTGDDDGVRQSPGPIDNSDLVNPATTQLLKDLEEGKDFKVVPEEVVWGEG